MATDLIALIKEKQGQIAKLQAELEEAKALLLNGVGRHLLAESSRPQRAAIRVKGRRGKPVVPFKSESSVGLALRVLREEGAPLHVRDIVERIGKLGHEVGKTTLVGNLARLVKAEKLFFRAGPNVFGLKEWEK